MNHRTVESGKEPSVYFGQIDTYSAMKDYQRGGRCLRVFAIEESVYERVRLNSPEGVPVFALDIDYWTYCRSVLGPNAWLTERARAAIDEREARFDERSMWYKFEVDWDGARRDGYAYRLFSEEGPRFFHLLSSSAVESNLQLDLDAPPSLVPERVVLSKFSDATTRIQMNWRLVAFHVGQGMCSLVTNGEFGVLLDLGAGAPVTRPKYQNFCGFVNELRTQVKSLEILDLVLSHADADHWRILSWDDSIRSKIRNIFIPCDAKSIAFKDSVVISKTKHVGDISFELSPGAALNIYRSRPAQSDDNSECLVAVFESGGKRALVSGDYVYRRYCSDAHSSINNLHQLDFDAVVVPHHGDLASADRVVPAKPGALAFFSAGTHKKYGHPTCNSRSAHASASYTEVCNPTCPDIRGVVLL